MGITITVHEQVGMSSIIGFTDYKLLKRPTKKGFYSYIKNGSRYIVYEMLPKVK